MRQTRPRRLMALGPLLATLGLALVGACEPTTPPPGAGSSPTGAPNPSGLVAGKPDVTVSGNKVTITGLANGTTPEFDLPAGNAQMTVSECSSNQVIPFVTLYDANDTKLGLIVDAVYDVRNLAGGKYYLAVATNPDCVWTIELTPK